MLVGLVVNPGASRDVRRLTSLARTVDAVEQANAVARILCGLAATGVGRVLYMPEPTHVVERARELLAVTRGAPARLPDTVPVRLPGTGEARDAAGTARSAAEMGAAGAAAVLTIGGDGTNRAVATGWPDAVFVPLPGGTNNAFALRLDPTAAGQAAGLYAAEPAAFAGDVRRRPYLRAEAPGGSTLALVDVALVRGGWVGAHAIWEPEALAEAVVARADPTVPGLAGVAGAAHPVRDGDGAGVHVVFGPGGRPILGQIGPGQVVELRVTATTVFGPGDTVTLPAHRAADGGPLTLAFDGEREVVLRPGQRATVRLVTPGVRVLDGAAVLVRAARMGRLVPPAMDGDRAETVDSGDLADRTGPAATRR